MASITHEIAVAAPACAVWDAVRDWAALHTRLVPGTVTAVVAFPESDPPVRIVTFADGTVLRERIVAIDDDAMRLVWSIEGEPVVHHNGALQVVRDGDGARAIWTADVLPDALAAPFGELMTKGLATMAAHLERLHAQQRAA